MTRPSGAAALVYQPSAAATAKPALRAAGRQQALFAGVLAVLLAMGWAANHFAALIPAISDRQHLTTAAVDIMFGIYALGLLPGLLLGGRASDTFGRPSVALAGSGTALAGTVTMLASQQSEALLIGRLVVGLGVGLAVSSCTAWASDLKGPAGAALAGTVLITGFALGPFASGVTASAGHSGVPVSFGIAAAVIALAMVGAGFGLRRANPMAPTSERTRPVGGHSTRRALSWAMPLAPWVFISATLAFVTIPTRVHTGLAAPLAAGTAALITNGASGISQVVARARRWGPQTGTVGALLAAIGYVVVAATPADIPLGLGIAVVMMLGCASGLCLREGLIDLEAAAPQRVRGTLTGTFYSVTYLGFGLPLLLTMLGPGRESTLIFVTLAGLAAAAAIGRSVRLRRNGHRQT
ncbi:MFS transporter [Mycobacterium camsae]|uniref:MFS transporter n=1 Tax=Mycobacterium gordonae TaxID=1778 RepID=UPI001F11F92E|nr:MFS transporter [Mycobacterium gordonae]